MKHFWKNAGRGYKDAVEFVNVCWSYLYGCEWRHSLNDMLVAYLLFMALLLATPLVYLCIAPVAAFLEGTREEGE